MAQSSGMALLQAGANGDRVSSTAQHPRKHLHDATAQHELMMTECRWHTLRCIRKLCCWKQAMPANELFPLSVSSAAHARASLPSTPVFSVPGLLHGPGAAFPCASPCFNRSESVESARNIPAASILTPISAPLGLAEVFKGGLLWRCVPIRCICRLCAAHWLLTTLVCAHRHGGTAKAAERCRARALQQAHSRAVQHALPCAAGPHLVPGLLCHHQAAGDKPV